MTATIISCFTATTQAKPNGHFCSRWGDGTGVSPTLESDIKHYAVLAIEDDVRVIYTGGTLGRTPPIADYDYDPCGNWADEMSADQAWSIAEKWDDFCVTQYPALLQEGYRLETNLL